MNAPAGMNPSPEELAVGREYRETKEKFERQPFDERGIVEVAKKLEEASTQFLVASTNVRDAERQLLEAKKHEARVRAHRDVWVERLKRVMP